MSNPPNNILNLGKPSAADLPGGQPAGLWANQVNAAGAQGINVLLRCRVFEHIGVHGGADEQRRRGSKCGQADQFFRKTERESGDDCGSGWGDDEQVGAASEGDVRLREIGVCVPHVRVDAAACNAPEGDGRNETGRFGRHNDIYVSAGLSKLAGQIDGLVDSDTAGDAKDDGAIGEIVHRLTSVHLIYHAQTQQSQIRVYRVNYTRLTADCRGVAAGADNFRLAAQLLLDAGNDSF